jgi:probable addiction module antidote protein
MPGQEDGRTAVTGEMIDVINAAFHSKDVNEIAKAIGAATKAQNFSDVARRAGIARPSLYRAFDREGAYPNMTTVVRTLDAMGLELKVSQTRKRRGQNRPVVTAVPDEIGTRKFK